MLAHELSHVAHRDVLVMTLASSAGIVAGMVMRGAQFGGSGSAVAATTTTAAAIGFVPSWSISLVVYAISFLLLRLLSRYRELCADRAGAYLTGKPSALATALTKISGEMAPIPSATCARAQADERLLHRPGRQRRSVGTLTATHPSLEQRLEQLAKIAAEPRPDPLSAAADMGFWDALRGQSQAAPAKLDALFALPPPRSRWRPRGFTLTGSGAVCFRAAEGHAAGRRSRRPSTCSTSTADRRRRAARRVRLHLADRAPDRRTPARWSPTCTR